jgi:serine/threonine protein kinase
VNLDLERMLERVERLPSEERAAFLASECPDPAVRAELAALLGQAQDAGAWLEAAIRAVAQSLRRTGEPRPGDIIGAYRILRPIGEGGMGTVYLAERTDGEIHQRVALKLVRDDMHRPAWRERFLKERQMLACLNHPSVVRMIDVGRTEDGRPFLAMEHVEGVPIDQYAAGIDVGEVLKLFIRVCEGISHAHRHLIVHRDLKPSNILVDSAGQPKILDFGIAKLLSETGDMTQTADQLMTPTYASPEQLRGNPQSTACDVYSLGAVLYNLITGALPRENAAQLPHQEVAWPSRLNPKVPVDLNFVVSKALRPEPEDRYSSVDEFANDVQAVLELRPVEARGDDRWYRARRGIRHHWMPLSAAILVTASLAAGLFVAGRERSLAERRFNEVRQLANKLFDIEYETRKLPGSTKVSQLIVDTSLDYLRRLASDVRGDPSLALEVGNAYIRVARVQGVPTGPNLGQMEAADRNLVVAQTLIQSVRSSDAANRAALLRLAQIAQYRMLLARYRGRSDDALTLARQSAARLATFRPEAADLSEASPILNTYLNVADQHARAGQLDEALRLCQLAHEFSISTGRRDYVPDFLWISADIHRRRGELEQALSELNRSVELSRPAEGQSEVWRVGNFALALICRGDLLGEQNAISFGWPKEALDSLEHGFRIADEMAHRDPSDQAVRSRVANAGISIVRILSASDPVRALEFYDHTFRHVAEIERNGSFRRFEIALLAASSYPLRRLRRFDEARRRLDAALDRLRQLELYPSVRVTLGSETEDTLRALADLEAGGKHFPKAIAIYQELLDRMQPEKSGQARSLADAVRLSTVYRSAAAIHRRAGDVATASALERRDRDMWQFWDGKIPQNAFVRGHLTTFSIRSFKTLNGRASKTALVQTAQR